MASPENDREMPPPFLYFDNLPAWRHETSHARVAAGPHSPTVLHKKPTKHGRTLRPYPVGAVLLIILFVGLSLAFVCLHAKEWMQGPNYREQFDLRAQFPGSKVNSNSHDWQGLFPQATLEWSLAKDKNVRTAQDLKSEWTLPLALEAGKAIPAPAGFLEPQKLTQVLTPVVFDNEIRQPGNCFNETQPGVTPMLRNWTTLTYFSLLAVTLSSQHTAFGMPHDGPAPMPQVTKEDFESLTKKLEAVEKALKETMESHKTSIVGEIGRVKEMKELKDIKEIAEANKSLLETQGRDNSKGLATLEQRVEKLHTMLNDIKWRLAGLEGMPAKSGTDTRISAAPPTNLGRIDLVNMYNEDILFVINGTPYRVPPYSNKELAAQPAGVQFRYEVISGRFGSLRSGTPLLEAGKTYTLTVRP